MFSVIRLRVQSSREQANARTPSENPFERRDDLLQGDITITIIQKPLQINISVITSAQLWNTGVIHFPLVISARLVTSACRIRQRLVR